MTKISSLKLLMVEELRDIYSAETQLAEFLPEVVESIDNLKLKNALTHHLSETKEHIARLAEIGKLLKEDLKGKTCQAMKGLIKEAREGAAEKFTDPKLKDILIIACAQRIEHYEISAYGTTRAMAEVLGLEDIVEMLQETLDEEDGADTTLNDICEDELFPSFENQAEAGLHAHL